MAVYLYLSAQDLDAALPLIEKYEEHLVAIGEVKYYSLKGSRSASINISCFEKVKTTFHRWGSILLRGL